MEAQHTNLRLDMAEFNPLELIQETQKWESQHTHIKILVTQ